MRLRVGDTRSGLRETPHDFCLSLATWTTYKSYREQLALNESVQLEKKNVRVRECLLSIDLALLLLE